jgi:hypothetical protein
MIADFITSRGMICDGCNQRRNRLRFSNKQWKDYVDRKYKAKSLGKNPANVMKPKCRDCTGEPAQDKQCVGCEKLLPLNLFSKAARKQRDNAVRRWIILSERTNDHQRCIDCTQEREDLEADPLAAIQEQIEYDKLARHVRDHHSCHHLSSYMIQGTSTYTGTSIAGSALASDSGWPGYGNTSNAGTNERSEGGGVWMPKSAEDDGDDDTLSQPPSMSGLSISGAKQSNSVQRSASNGGWDGFAPIERTRKTSSVAGSANTFAKQSAYRPTVKQRMEDKFLKDKAKKEAAAMEPQDDSDSSRSSASDFEL